MTCYVPQSSAPKELDPVDGSVISILTWISLWVITWIWLFSSFLLLNILCCVLTQKDPLVLPNAHTFSITLFLKFKNVYCVQEWILFSETISCRFTLFSAWYKYQHELSWLSVSSSLDPSWQNQLKLDPLPLLLIRLIIEVRSSIRESRVWTHNQGGNGRWYYWQYSLLDVNPFLNGSHSNSIGGYVATFG